MRLAARIVAEEGGQTSWQRQVRNFAIVTSIRSFPCLRVRVVRNMINYSIKLIRHSPLVRETRELLYNRRAIRTIYAFRFSFIYSISR